jgi:poly(3-hydroxybutyrate) depolymerase
MRNLRRRHFLVLLAVTLLNAQGVWAQRGPQPVSETTPRIEARTYYFEEAGRDIPYEIYLPTGYDDATPTPLIILLHGLGSNPTQVIRYQGLTDEAEARGYIVAAPMGYNERGWYGSRGDGAVAGRGGQASVDPPNLGELSEMDVMNVLAIMREEFNIDADRMYLMGHSMGGAGAFHIGTKYPEYWSAIGAAAPATAPAGMSPDRLDDARIPAIVVQGTADNLVSVESVRPWIEHMRESGIPYEYVEIENGDHTFIISRTPENVERIFDFFDRHTRPAQ